MLAIRIVGLTALVLLSIVPMASPHRPVLTTQFFSRLVSLVTWNRNQVSIPAPSFCFSGVGGVVSYGGLNFTEDLSGRDPGSTWIQFNSGIIVQVLHLFRSQDITLSLLDQFACSTPTNAQLTLFGHIQIENSLWRVPASGNYILFAECTCDSFDPNALAPFTANESWTVTTIS